MAGRRTSARPIATRHALAVERLGIKEVDEAIWLVSFMHHDLGYFGDETCRLKPIDDPFGAKVLPMSPE
jgi:putative transposase